MSGNECVGTFDYHSKDVHTEETVLQLKVFKIDEEPKIVCIPVELITHFCDLKNIKVLQGIRYYRMPAVLNGGEVNVSEELGQFLRDAVNKFYTVNEVGAALPLTYFAINRGTFADKDYYERLTLLDAANGGFVEGVKALLGAPGIDVNEATDGFRCSSRQIRATWRR